MIGLTDTTDGWMMMCQMEMGVLEIGLTDVTLVYYYNYEAYMAYCMANNTSIE